MSSEAVVETPMNGIASAGVVKNWFRYLNTPIDGSSVAVFRIWFGVCMVINVWLYQSTIVRDYIQPKLMFPFITGLHPLPGSGMVVLFAVMAASAALLGLGWFYRAAAIVFMVAQTYSFLLEKAYYQNHFYLVCLLAFLFCLIPANRIWSLDAWGKKNQDGRVPRWALLSLKLQILIVYFYAGIAKFNFDWLVREQPQTTYFCVMFRNSMFEPIGSSPWFTHLVTYGGVLFDLSIGFLLWWQPTFWLGAVLALFFHLMNARLFQIGIFPWLMLGTIGLFAPPDWPKRALSKSGLLPPDSDNSYAAVAKRARLGVNGATLSSQTVGDSGEETSPKNVHAFGQPFGQKFSESLNVAVLVLLHVYVVIQLLVPLRHWLYPGEVTWTEQGHRFSWQMMLRIKNTLKFLVEMVNPVDHKRTIVDLDSILNKKQIDSMQTRPDMILHLAHFLADQEQKRTGVRPEIYVTAEETLNVREPQDLVDPTVNLASQPEGQIPAPWIVPLKSDTASGQ